MIGFTLKRVRDMIRTYNQMHCTDKFSQHNSVIWSVWLNGEVFVYELKGCGFKSRCSHIPNSRYNFEIIFAALCFLLKLKKSVSDFNNTISNWTYYNFSPSLCHFHHKFSNTSFSSEKKSAFLRETVLMLKSTKWKFYYWQNLEL